LSGTWGDTVNNSITSLLDTSVAGTTNVSTDGDVTLTTTTGAANTARQAILLFSGARTALRTVTAPAQSKVYTVINATTGGFSVKLVGAGPTTGLTIPNGASAVVAWNGSDFVEIGAGSIGNLIVNGTLTVTGVATFSAGSAAAPAITTTGDTNTGIFFPAADTIAFAEGGVEAARFDSSGNLGVGTTNPAAYGKLAVNGSANVLNGNFLYMWDSGNTNAPGMYAPGDAFAWKNSAGSTEWMRINSTGLGIGTSSPAQKLQISANEPKLRITSTAASGKSWDISSGGNTTVTLGHFCIYDTATDAQRFNIISGSGQLLLDGSGNLGLGVTPSATSGGKSFEIAYVGSSVMSTAAGQMNMTANVYYNSGWKYAGTGTALLYQQSGTGDHAWYNAASGTAGNAISWTQAMTLDASGNLLVGGTSAGYSASGRGVIEINGSASSLLAFRIGSTNKSYIFQDGTNFNFASSIAGGSLIFQTQDTERARLDSGGNFGVGTSSPGTYGKLVSYNVGGGAYAIAAVGNDQSNNRIRLKNVGGGGGDFTIVGGTPGISNAGLAIFDETNSATRMLINSSGNVGIGTASPSARLSVSNSAGGNVASFTDTSSADLQINLTAGVSLLTPSTSILAFGTANTERARIDSSGNFIVGGTSYQAGGAFSVATTGTFTAVLDSGAGGDFLMGAINGVSNGYQISVTTGNVQTYRWNTNNVNTMTLDSGGNLLVGTTSAMTGNGSDGKIGLQSSGSVGNFVVQNSADNNFYIAKINGYTNSTYLLFSVNGTSVGSITTTGSATAYNTTSDQRLKENIVDSPEFGSVIDSIQVRSFTWKSNQSHQRAGLIAQELLTVVPEAVHQPEDTEQMMAVDYSKLVPMLVKEIQSLRKRLADAGI
jgi:hypothetical protein